MPTLKDSSFDWAWDRVSDCEYLFMITAAPSIIDYVQNGFARQSNQHGYSIEFLERGFKPVDCQLWKERQHAPVPPKVFNLWLRRTTRYKDQVRFLRLKVSHGGGWRGRRGGGGKKKTTFRPLGFLRSPERKPTGQNLVFFFLSYPPPPPPLHPLPYTTNTLPIERRFHTDLRA